MSLLFKKHDFVLLLQLHLHLNQQKNDMSSSTIHSEKDRTALFNAFVLRHKTMIWHICSDYGLGKAWNVEDCIQEVMANLWRRLPTLDSGSAPRQVNRWLQRVMHTTFLDYLRRHPLRPRTVPLDAADGLADGKDYDDELLDALLAHLDDGERETISCYLAGYRAAEIAERHGLSAAAVRQRIHRIILKMKTIYREYYEQ